MNDVLINRHNIATLTWKKHLALLWPVIVGMLILFVPTFYDLVTTGLWSTADYAHGPIILALSLWLIARQWSIIPQYCAAKNDTVAGWSLCLFALLLYISGRSQDILIFEIGSFIILLAALLIIQYGRGALKFLWFPFFFMFFMIPLPGSIVSTLTMPMKMAVSYVTENILFRTGLPIARSGVILHIGQYKLMVADACAGLHTLLTLEAMGLFYLNLIRHTSIFRNVVLAMLIIPISFVANVIRVMMLTLITYYFGDAAGQGFLHRFASLVLFVTALLLIMCLDLVLQYAIKIYSLRSSKGKAITA